MRKWVVLVFSDIGFLFLLLTLLSLELAFSLFHYDPGFGQKTLYGRLYAHPLVTVGLIAIIAAALGSVRWARPERRRATGAVFGGALLVIGVVSGFVFDPLLMLLLAVAASALMRSAKGD